MRASTLILGAALTLALGVTVSAQQGGGAFFNGVNPRNVTFVPIDTNKAIKNMNVNNAFRTPAQSKPLSLSTIFPKVHMPTWPPSIPSIPILSQKNNPYQPNPIMGKNPFMQTPAK